MFTFNCGDPQCVWGLCIIAGFFSPKLLVQCCSGDGLLEVGSHTQTQAEAT